MLEKKTVERVIRVDALVMLFDSLKPKGFYFPGESHDFWEGVYVCRGRVTATADERIYRMKEGQLLFHKPMEFHRLWAENDETPEIINISFCAGGSQLYKLENTCFDLDAEQQHRFAETVAAFACVIEAEKEKKDFSDRYDLKASLAASKLEAFLTELADNGEHAHRSRSGDEVRYSKIVKVMKENCEKMLSLRDLASLCDMSVSNMKRIFKCYCDVGVAKYFLSLKMRQAKKYLDDGVPASKIARLLGYNEINYFYTVFKRETGMTPADYRKKH